jgi:uncharacterized phage protein (predicted DNA packaging)
MIVTVEEIKTYLRVDTSDDDELLESIITAAQKQCMDVIRTDDEEEFAKVENAKISVMFATAYLYEHREEADHHAMNLTLRALLFGNREVQF